MSVEKSDENSMEGLEETIPLSDVRRTRTRSTGRPPSQHFLKDHALQRTVSIECDDLPNERHETLSDSNDSILDEVLEITGKKMEDKETADVTKKNSVIQPKQIVKEEIPWMKEFLKKKERKRSLLEDEKKSIEEFVKNDEINRRVGTTYEFIKTSSFSKFDKERNIPKNEDDGKHQKPACVRKKSEDATAIDENIVTRSKMVVSETNSEKYSSMETHQVATTTESSSIQSISKRFNIESHSKKPVELPRVELTKTESSKIETLKAGLNISNVTKVNNQISAPKLPIPSNDIEDQMDKSEKSDEKESNKIQIQELFQIQELLLKIKNFEETANKRMKNIRNELKVLHREVASHSEYVTEFVKTLENDLASITNGNAN